ncbi:MAG: hypothetical protein H6595_03225 [Flavobacteriales bacterium]|nr:hypothetical protein [Flavobacteriales bacterium]MCB9166469.1 hypothetical protein [Flavobacteriales bacterium]
MRPLRSLLLLVTLAAFGRISAQDAQATTCYAFLFGTINGTAVMTDAVQVDIHAMNADIIALFDGRIPADRTPARWEVVRSNDASSAEAQQKALAEKYAGTGLRVEHLSMEK